MTDTKFAKYVIGVNGAVPALILGWDAYHHALSANPVNHAIRTTGMLALIFLSLSLLITPIRRLTGFSAIVAVRRALGLYAFGYASLHFTIFFWFDRGASVGSTFSEIIHRQYLWYGMTSLAVMAPLAATSTNGMIQRLGARRWQMLHQLTYVAIVAGVIHYYQLVKSDVQIPIAFAIVAAALLGFRFVMHYRRVLGESQQLKRGFAPVMAKGVAPLMAKAKPRFWTGKLRVVRVFDETPSARTFRLAAADGGDLPFDYRAGQYLNIALMIDGKRVNRSYTIASSPTRVGYCELTVKREESGLASRYLHGQIRQGDTVQISAPAGRFTFDGTEADSIVLIGAGVGITPLMSVVRYLTDKSWGGDIYLVYASRTRADIIFRNELEYLAARFPNLHVTFTLTRSDEADWAGEKGRVTAALLARVVPGIGGRLVHLCGPTEMMEPMKEALRGLGVPEAKIRSEAFLSPGTPGASDAPADGVAVLAEAMSKTADVTTMAIDEMTRADGAPMDGQMLTFSLSGKTVIVAPKQSILEASEDAGVNIPFDCRSGICGQCKTRLVSGRVNMDVRDALSGSEEAKGLILACQAIPLEAVTVEA